MRRSPVGLLGAHVLRRAERQPGLRDAAAAGVAHGERDAEVGDQRLPVVQQDVLGLEVAMDHAVRGARSRARSATAVGDADGLVDGQLLLAVEPSRATISPSTNGMT